MAKKKVRPQARRRKPKEMGGFAPLLFIALAGLAAFQLEAAILAATGLVPTIVLGFTGKGTSKSEKLQCVSFTNLAGVMTMMPGVLDRPSSVYDIIEEPINLLIMWGAAGFGYALIFVGPLIASMLLQTLAQDRLKNITQQKQALVELWGSEVLGDRDPPAVPSPGLRRR